MQVNIDVRILLRQKTSWRSIPPCCKQFETAEQKTETSQLESCLSIKMIESYYSLSNLRLKCHKPWIPPPIANFSVGGWIKLCQWSHRFCRGKTLRKENYLDKSKIQQGHSEINKIKEKKNSPTWVDFKELNQSWDKSNDKLT